MAGGVLCRPFVCHQGMREEVALSDLPYLQAMRADTCIVVSMQHTLVPPWATAS